MGRWGVTATLALLSTTIAGCSSGSQPHTQTPSPSATLTTATSPTASIDPNAQPAVDAYLAFNAAATTAQRDPQKASKGGDQASDIKPYTFDPLRAEYTTYIMSLAYQQVAFRGTPPKPRLGVASVDLNAKPYPKVVLTNCNSPAPNWEEYEVKTGKVVPDAKATVPPPYKTTIETIYYEQRWGVAKITIDRSKTCTA